MSNPTNINTGGGASVEGNVQAERDFIGRDQVNIAVQLHDVNDAVQATRTIVAALDQDDRESESIRADLLGLMEELRKTHSTIVKTVSPLRRIQDNADTFASNFESVYNDFRDFYDAYDFWEERTRCHKIRQLSDRLQQHRSPITQTPEWGELQRNLFMLSDDDTDLIEAYYRPFMEHFNAVMVKIHQDVVDQKIGEAITLKRVFLEEVTPQYDGIKQVLGQMTATIANIELALG